VTGYPELYSSIYRRVREVPYGKTATYKEIGIDCGTSPRVVGQAMSRNPTPLIVPCHRIVSKSGPGGFTPSPEIKVALLGMEKAAVERQKKTRATGK
jgi:methylated-DNA-[protein]-cysteine S-methyltransferase